MRTLHHFLNEDSGAVTVDWVVLTSAIVGIAMAMMLLISGGISTGSNNISAGMSSVGSYDFTKKDATKYFDFGIAAYPDNQTQAWRAGRLEVDTYAPAGYNYDPEFTTTRYVDTSSGNPIYVSDDGLSYSIGGEVVLASEYNGSGSDTFKSTFDAYWVETQ